MNNPVRDMFYKEVDKCTHEEGIKRISLDKAMYYITYLEKQLEITDKEKDFLATFESCLEKQLINIRVDIKPEQAVAEDGKWNVSKTCIRVGQREFEFDGCVEIIKGV